MAAPRLAKADTELIETFEFEFSEPPAKEGTRKSKLDERFEAARTLCMKFPGKTLKVVTYEKQGQPYALARAINNGDHRSFKDDFADWKAVAGKEVIGDNEEEPGSEQEVWSVWLTYEPKGDPVAE